MRTPSLRSQDLPGSDVAGEAPMPAAAPASPPAGAPGPLRYSPPNRARPPDPGETSPVMHRIKVVFPAPLGPSSTYRAPRGTERLRPCRASTRPLPDLKVTRRSRASRTGAACRSVTEAPAQGIAQGQGPGAERPEAAGTRALADRGGGIAEGPHRLVNSRWVALPDGLAHQATALEVEGLHCRVLEGNVIGP